MGDIHRTQSENFTIFLNNANLNNPIHFVIRQFCPSDDCKNFIRCFLQMPTPLLNNQETVKTVLKNIYIIPNLIMPAKRF